MKKLILHAGTPKTGSSVLQVFWAQNYEELRNRSVEYFQVGDFRLGAAGKISSGNGAHIARSFLSEQNPIHLSGRDALLEALDTEIKNSPCEIGLLSSEIFIDASPDVLTQFREWLQDRGIELQVFFFIRNQVQFLASSYIQQVKRHGCTEMPDEYVNRAFKNIHYLKYSTLVDRFSEIIGRENVYCRSYDAASAGKVGIFSTLLGAFGISSEGLTPVEEDVNTSLRPNEVMIMLMINRMKPRMTFSDYLVENAVRRGDMAAGVQHNILSDKVVRQIEQYFDEDNRKLARSYFKREQLFEKASLNTSVNPVSGAALSLGDVIDCFGGLFVRFDERLLSIEQRLNKLSQGK